MDVERPIVVAVGHYVQSARFVALQFEGRNGPFQTSVAQSSPCGRSDSGHGNRSVMSSDFEVVPLLGRNGVEHRHQENADQQPREQATDDHERERLLGIGPDAGRQRRREQA